MQTGRIDLYIRAGAARRASREYLQEAVERFLASDRRACREERLLPTIPVGPVSAWRLEKGENGKPFYPDVPCLHFSVSHSGMLWICALSVRPVGADLQEHGRKKKSGSAEAADALCRIADRFFHPAEACYLHSLAASGPRAQETAFYDIWAAKESYVKYTGEGIGKNFGAFSVSDGNGLLSAVCAPAGPPAMLHFLKTEPGYSLCVCAEKVENVAVKPLAGA